MTRRCCSRSDGGIAWQAIRRNGVISVAWHIGIGEAK